MNAHTGHILLFILVLCVGISACKAGVKKDSDGGEVNNDTVTDVLPKSKEIQFEGMESKNGMFDISIEYDDEGVGWLAYSRVQIPKFIDTKIAKSTDRGRTWKFVTSVGESKEDLIMARGKKTEGVWRDETPCLLFDPTDRKSRRWKLFTNRYFAAKPFKTKDRLMGDGTIDVKYASSPEGPWSKPECVVRNRSDCKFQLNKASPELANIRMITEPGAIIHNGVTYLAMDAGTNETGLGDWKNYRVILLASSDHGASWRYVGTLLDHSDSSRFGYLVFTGVSLVRANGKLYVLATPSGGVKKKNKAHDGTMVIEVTDISRAKVKRDKSGKPVIERHAVTDGGSGGLADYDEKNTGGGMMYSRLSLLGFPRVFRIYQTGSGILDSK